jgi:hypothetical protein
MGFLRRISPLLVGLCIGLGAQYYCPHADTDPPPTRGSPGPQRPPPPNHRICLPTALIDNELFEVVMLGPQYMIPSDRWRYEGSGHTTDMGSSITVVRGVTLCTTFSCCIES